MVQDIAALFRANSEYAVYPEVELFKRFPDDEYPEELGDYDVVAINTSRKEIWLIESKVLQKVGSIYEDQMQQKSFFFHHKDDEKFQRRIDYVKENTSKVLGELYQIMLLTGADRVYISGLAAAGAVSRKSKKVQ